MLFEEKLVVLQTGMHTRRVYFTWRNQAISRIENYWRIAAQSLAEQSIAARGRAGSGQSQNRESAWGWSGGGSILPSPYTNPSNEKGGKREKRFPPKVRHEIKGQFTLNGGEQWRCPDSNIPAN